MSKVGILIKKEIVFVISFAVMIVTMFFITPSKEYVGYINLKVLVVMFTLMLSVGGLYQENVFNFLAIKIVKHLKNVKYISLTLIGITFFLGMFITNDAVLITLIPLSILIFKQIKQEKHLIILLILQTLAANIGSAITPMGDPQNIFLFTKFSLSFTGFIHIMFPVSLIGFLLLIGTSLICIPNVKVSEIQYDAHFKSYKPAYYILVFVATILAILEVIPYYVVLIGVVVSFVFVDAKVIKRVDFFLLLTFLCFFIISGNVVRMELFASVIRELLRTDTSVYWVSLGLSQVTSNVPAAVLLSNFIHPEHIAALLRGVNVGAMGTMIASLASLITFKYVRVQYPKEAKRYILIYSLCSIIFISIISALLLFF